MHFSCSRYTHSSISIRAPVAATVLLSVSEKVCSFNGYWVSSLALGFLLSENWSNSGETFFRKIADWAGSQPQKSWYIFASQGNEEQKGENHSHLTRCFGSSCFWRTHSIPLLSQMTQESRGREWDFLYLVIGTPPEMEHWEKRFSIDFCRENKSIHQHHVPLYPPLSCSASFLCPFLPSLRFVIKVKS